MPSPLPSPEEELAAAIESGRLAEAVSLLERGADVSRPAGRRDELPMFGAARKEDAGFLMALIEHGAKVNARDALGETPLIVAVRYGHEASIDYLLAQGANAALKTKEGDTAATVANKIFENNVLNFLSAALDGVLRPDEQAMIDKWRQLTERLKGAEALALSTSLQNNVTGLKRFRVKAL